VPLLLAEAAASPKTVPLCADYANIDHARVAVPNREARPGGGRGARVRAEGARQPRPGCAVDGTRGPAPNQLLEIAILAAASTGLGISLLATASSNHGVHCKI
jgi:hypothetical protein